MLEIMEANATQISLVRELFLEYARSLDFDLGFQGFSAEVAALPGEYAFPNGCLLLGFVDGDVAGVVGLRELAVGAESHGPGARGGLRKPRLGEMKRLYVRPKFQGRGIGRALCLAVAERAHVLGYQKIRLDTVPSMQAAKRMYESLGFYAIAPYRENPVAGASFWEKEI